MHSKKETGQVQEAKLGVSLYHKQNHKISNFSIGRSVLVIPSNDFTRIPEGAAACSNVHVACAIRKFWNFAFTWKTVVSSANFYGFINDLSMVWPEQLTISHGFEQGY